MKLTKKQIENRIKWANKLQSSRKAKSFLSSYYSQNKCCLGVALNSICNIPKRYTDGRVGPQDIGILNVMTGQSIGVQIMQDTFGLRKYEMSKLMTVNDAIGEDELSHKEIGMYLYLTAYSGGTPYNH